MGKAYYWVASFALLLSLIVIMLGAYTRLSEAGLGCPDWPGCYGKLIVPKNKTDLAHAQKNFPHQPLVAEKAWKEMVHRYVAGALGILIAWLAVWGLVRRHNNPSQPLLILYMLIGMIALQIILGMWTVTMKVMPLIVMGHLMGGMTIAALLCWLCLRSKPKSHTLPGHYSRIKPWAVLGLLILILQIFLGAWTSTNYAALACPSFPFCHGSLFPAFAFGKAFNVLAPIGPNYQGGHLGMDARVTIQMVHRFGALITTAFWTPFALYLTASKTYQRLRRWGWCLLILVATQISLGILNVVALLPMPIAVSHNGVAALFLIVVVAFIYQLKPHPQEPQC